MPVASESGAVVSRHGQAQGSTSAGAVVVPGVEVGVGVGVDVLPGSVVLGSVLVRDGFGSGG